MKNRREEDASMGRQKNRTTPTVFSWALLALALGQPCVVADSFSFGLLPADGNVLGAPGSTVGWGYTIKNDSRDDWLITTGLQSDTFYFGTPLPIFDFPDLAPGQSISVPFDAIHSTGLFELTWDRNAPIGYTNFGYFTLNSQWWTGPPTDGGVFIRNARDASAGYSATVSGVPEAAGIFLVALGIVGIFCASRLRRDAARTRDVVPLTPFYSMRANPKHR